MAALSMWLSRLLPKPRTLTAREMACLRALVDAGGCTSDETPLHQEWRNEFASLSPTFISSGNFWAPFFEITDKGREAADEASEREMALPQRP